MRSVIAGLPGSKIREVANAGLGRPDVLAFWFGESDEVTPEPVRAAAAASLAAGETFYAHNLGLPELREAIAAYTASLHPAVGAGRIAVTSSGVSALMLAMQALAGAGDEVVAVVPVWPNLTAQPEILGARVVRVPLVPRAGAWRLDLEALLAAVTDRTRVLLVNAPNNPTGWTLTRPEQQALLDHCRRTGTWIVADEVYERLYYVPGAACAPSFLDLATPEDRVVAVHSFSKSFLMTGWRLGWMVAPAPLVEALGKLIEFNTSCAPVFVQRAGLAALAGAAASVPALVHRLRACRDTLLPALAALPGVETAVPDGGMYAFFRVAGQGDSLAFAKRLVAEHGLGLAPGAAFGPEAEGWLRWCFASRDPQRLLAGVQRLAGALPL
ncbi:MAG: pyridoxal phosphate-dependent aminotransferase [Piscinibacter sp.]|uniref:pyridoxal phosphate-dependent aminotransferase n=1 Tax=Piscinibacter sp. TaxID=1903157 RepID=UPI0025840819|nr:pyridoxal phosphate-dependent aminotransferase [Piscinibacter sp.]MCW5663492.1 pyridoxal phosphate-dependent aminotransferase [Piscinibacter sp.]